jgi:hypothetical protein
MSVETAIGNLASAILVLADAVLGSKESSCTGSPGVEIVMPEKPKPKAQSKSAKKLKAQEEVVEVDVAKVEARVVQEITKEAVQTALLALVKAKSKEAALTVLYSFGEASSISGVPEANWLALLSKLEEATSDE